MLCARNNFGNNWVKFKELLERIIGNFKSIMYLNLTTADNATWDQLIAALRSVGLDYFASELNESIRNTECKIYSLFTISCSKAANGCGTSLY